jgi:hypothetical protein
MAMPDTAPDNKPGRGLLGWLGRQVGYVKKAVKTDVTAPPQPQIVFRQKRVEEQPLPHDPSVTLRRTTIDEAVQTKGQPCDQSD